MRISDWSSDVCSSDRVPIIGLLAIALSRWLAAPPSERPTLVINQSLEASQTGGKAVGWTRSIPASLHRSEEHTSELQSLMRISYAVFCLKKKHKQNTTQTTISSISHTEITLRRYTTVTK